MKSARHALTICYHPQNHSTHHDSTYPPQSSPTRIPRRDWQPLLASSARDGWTVENSDFDNQVPADKKLSEDWLHSLFERGKPEWFHGEELNYIGMPVGGICCGQVYLSGDGRLWHWDIFNQGVKTDTGGSHYAKPMPVASAVDLGFQIRVNGETRSLDRTGFPQTRFRGAYPIGFVDYRDDALPVHISLEAFSPFTPLSDAGLVHRDVKPENILFFRGHPCLGDISLLGVDSAQITRRGTQPPFPRPPIRSNGSFRGLPLKANY